MANLVGATQAPLLVPGGSFLTARDIDAILIGMCQLISGRPGRMMQHRVGERKNVVVARGRIRGAMRIK